MLKALIVDDEPYIRKGILNKIDWNALGIEIPAEADDGIEALEYISKNDVDIILTDIKMPEMDGIQLIEAIKKKFGERHGFIIISGYGEFEYARRAMKFGVTDYLLKPIKEEELESTVKRLAAKLVERRKEEDYKKFLQASYNSSMTVIRDNLLFKLLCQKDYKQFIADSASEYGVEFPYDNFLVAVFYVEPLSKCISDFTEKDNALILFAVRNIIEEIFLKIKFSYVLKSGRNDRELAVIMNIPDEASGEIVPGLCLEAVNQIYKCLSIKSVAGIGNVCSGVHNMSESYSKACFAAKERIVKGYGRVYSVEHIKQSGHGSDILGDEVKKLLNNYLRDGKKDSILKIIDDIFESMRREPDMYSHLDVQELCLELYMFLNSYLKRHNRNISEMIGEKFEFLESIMDIESIEEISSSIKKCFTHAIESCSGNKKHTGEDIVMEAKDYIDKHYFENISLSSISQKYFIHPNYFCRLFRSIVGESFTDYLTSVRMSRAKELLRRTDLKLSSISGIVGYDDPRYFSQVFKKYFGMTPSEYQSSAEKQR